MATIGFRGRHLVPASANRRWKPELQPRVTLLPRSHTVAKSRDPLPGVAQSALTDGQAQHGGARAGGAGAGARSQAGEIPQGRVTGRKTKGTARGRTNRSAPRSRKPLSWVFLGRFHIEAASKTPNWRGPWA